MSRPTAFYAYQGFKETNSGVLFFNQIKFINIKAVNTHTFMFCARASYVIIVTFVYPWHIKKKPFIILIVPYPEDIIR